jgi:hypothetical protein
MDSVDNVQSIEDRLKWAVETLLEKRIRARANGGQPGKPTYFIIDEMPVVADRCKDASYYVGQLLRRGRNYGIYVMIISQSFGAKAVCVAVSGQCCTSVMIVRQQARCLVSQSQT